MGSPHLSGESDERPQHIVTIKPFMMSKSLITQEQWKAILRKLPPCRFKGDQLPVERVVVEGCTILLQTSLREDWTELSPAKRISMGIRLPRRDGHAIQLWRNSYCGGGKLQRRAHLWRGAARLLSSHQQTKGAPSHRMPSGCTICTAIYGNGAKTTGWTIIPLPPGMIVPIKTKKVPIASPAVVPGMSRHHFVEVHPGCESCKQMRMRLWGFGWCVR